MNKEILSINSRNMWNIVESSKSGFTNAIEFFSNPVIAKEQFDTFEKIADNKTVSGIRYEFGKTFQKMHTKILQGEELTGILSYLEIISGYIKSTIAK